MDLTDARKSQRAGLRFSSSKLFLFHAYFAFAMQIIESSQEIFCFQWFKGSSQFKKQNKRHTLDPWPSHHFTVQLDVQPRGSSVTHFVGSAPTRERPARGER